MSIGFDPVVSSLLFSASLIPHAARPKARLELPDENGTGRPFVSVIVALYREPWADVEMTLDSLLRQTYTDHFEVLFAVEADDEMVIPHAEAAAQRLRNAGIPSQLVVSHGGRRLKAYALNRAISRLRTGPAAVRLARELPE